MVPPGPTAQPVSARVAPTAGPGRSYRAPRARGVKGSEAATYPTNAREGDWGTRVGARPDGWGSGLTPGWGGWRR